MKPLILINDLIDQHGDTFTKCKDKGCLICKEIKRLRLPINSDISGEKIRELLGKGEMMTTGDVQFLIEAGALKADIRKALKMNAGDFWDFLGDIGLKRKKESEKEMKISKEGYESLKAGGKTDAQIGKEIGVSGATINYYKKKWYTKTKESVATKEYQEAKEKVAAAVKLDGNLEEALRMRITELEHQAKEYPELVRKVEKLEVDKIELTNEKDRLLISDSKKAIEIKQLKDAATDLEDEIDGLKKDSNAWEQKAHYYSSENEIMTNQYKDLRNNLESVIKENKLTKALLKEVL